VIKLPSSQFSQIPEILGLVHKISPNSILDVGCGNGKYGFLCKELLTYWLGKKEIKINAIEVFKAYIGPMQREIYDDIYGGEAVAWLKRMEDKEYDLILAIDILEHFEKADGYEFLSQLKRVGKHVIISTPKTPSKQGPVFGNSYEEHKSKWLPSEMGAKRENVTKNEENYIVHLVY
jgi:2-polyprenyl-3-methyl-5-hydroxy-6-metoxy-1,4-benzoquinol methylase